MIKICTINVFHIMPQLKKNKIPKHLPRYENMGILDFGDKAGKG